MKKFIYLVAHSTNWIFRIVIAAICLAAALFVPYFKNIHDWPVWQIVLILGFVPAFCALIFSDFFVVGLARVIVEEWEKKFPNIEKTRFEDRIPLLGVTMDAMASAFIGALISFFLEIIKHG